MSHKPVKAGRLMSRYMRAVSEETEFVKGEGSDDDKMVTKAELLVRKMWRIAEGYTEHILADGEMKKVVHQPDHKMMVLLLDRIEGRCATATEDTTTRPTTSAKISEQGKKRIAQAGGLTDETT